MSSERLGAWGRSTVETACPLDCPDSCSLAVSLEKGRVVTIDGSSQTRTTNGFICAKVRGFADRVYGQARLHHPMVRKGPKASGRFERVTWDEALAHIAERLRTAREQFGGESILPFYYGGSNGLVTQDSVDLDLFRRLGASRLARTVCAAATGAAAQHLYGKMPGVGYEDFVHARLIVVWGANPPVSGMHLVPFIREAQKRGAALVVIDPRATALARTADLHLAVRPGTDLPLALAVHRFLFEEGHAAEAFLAEHTVGSTQLRERARPWTFDRAARTCGVDAETVASFARLYAQSSPALIRCGWGLERNRNGGSAVAAVLALPAVAGKFGVRGGGYLLSNSSAWGVNGEGRARTAAPPTRVINMNLLGRTLLEPQTPPVSVLFVYNANPVATLPEQNLVIKGLLREDLFTVVFDQVHTDTVHLADVVLPATTFLETYDIAKGYGAPNLHMVKPVIDVVGESRPNVEVFGELMERLDLRSPGEATETEAEVLLRAASSLPDGMRERLMGGEPVTPPAGATPVQFVDVFPRTHDRRVDLFPDACDREAPKGLYVYQEDPASDQYPLALVSPASDKTISSTLGELRSAPARLYMHDADAAARALAEGDTVRVFNPRGEVHCLVTIGDRIAQGTVSLPKGLWRRSTLNESTANALSPDTLTDLGAGACFNDARVEVALVVRAGLGDETVSIFVAPDAGRPVS
jgi:anaerobic selenocysteine-containing dehydrogenase